VGNSQELFAAIEVKGLTVDGIRGMHVASLRYFNPAGNFAGAVRERIGRALPQPLRADAATLGSTALGSTTLISTIQGGNSKFILAWRSPTETLLLSEDRDAFAHLKESLASVPDGCMVDQTGGLCPVRVSGSRAGDMLLRLGSGASIPAAGEARSSRLADLQVMTLCVQPGTLILLVERVYLAHLLGWMSTTAADL
jgi:sarcosine oxidase gamma subunit